MSLSKKIIFLRQVCSISRKRNDRTSSRICIHRNFPCSSLLLVEFWVNDSFFSIYCYHLMHYVGLYTCLRKSLLQIEIDLTSLLKWRRLYIICKKVLDPNKLLDPEYEGYITWKIIPILPRNVLSCFLLIFIAVLILNTGWWTQSMKLIILSYGSINFSKSLTSGTGTVNEPRLMSWKRNNTFLFYYRWRRCSCQRYKHVKFCHGNAKVSSLCSVVDLQNISYCS